LEAIAVFLKLADLEANAGSGSAGSEPGGAEGLGLGLVAKDKVDK
jgi:hypothetical protein